VTATPRYFDDDLAVRANAVEREAIELLVDQPPNIVVVGRRYQVIVVAAPAGAGKTEFVCSVVDVVVKRNPRRSAVIAVATPTNDQAYELVRRIAQRIRPTVVAFVPASDRTLPPSTLALANVAQVEAAAAQHHAVVVGTLDKLSDVCGRGLLHGFRYLVVDESYQAHSAQYYGVAGIADRHLLVGDPGQLDPFTTMNDPHRWRGLREDPTQTAVAVLRANHPSVPVARLPITRRLPPSAVPVVSAFYPGHAFEAWTLPDARALTLLPAIGRGSHASLDASLDHAANAGWAYLRLPETPVFTADPATVDVITRLAERLAARSPRVRSERTKGRLEPLLLNRVAVAVSHNDQKDHVQTSLNRAGLADVRVDTANKLQGLEFDVVIAWHPLAGLPAPDGFHLDPGRLCVMLTRHRHACIVVGRLGDLDLLGSVPPEADAWLGHDRSPEIDGWFAHRAVFDQLAPLAVDVPLAR
jgi:AAA domain